MSCTKRSLSLFFFKINKPHRKKMTRLRLFGSYAWNEYEVQFSCKDCGCGLGVEVHTQGDLLRQGFSLEKLQQDRHILKGYSVDVVDLME